MAIELKEFIMEQEEIVSRLNVRASVESNGRDNQDRSEYMRDYARVLYSSSFRRLQGKMQLLAVDETRFNRNRLTHSLEVAQIARGVAHKLGLYETIVAETCSLIHDIGNPPYGHHGEVVLNRLSSSVGGYEGNAQAFRVVRCLEKKHPECDGLNLTLRTIFGITKYFNKIEDNDKKFLYEEDYSFLKRVLEERNITIRKSIDAQIMDLSDEIAYAAHDLEDAISLGHINIGELLNEFYISDKYKCVYQYFADMVKGVQEFAKKANRLETSEEYTIVFKKELTSRIVNALVEDIGLINNDGCLELGYLSLKKLAAGLKSLVFKTALRKNNILEYEKRGEKVITGLFEVYNDESFNKKLELLPAELRSRNEARERLICDYISGMMDAFAAKEYVKYHGESSYRALYRKYV